MRQSSAAGEAVLVRLDIDTLAAEPYTLGLKPQALLDRRAAAQFDLPARAQHSLPSKTKGGTQDLRNLASVSRQSRGSGHRPIGGNLPPGNLADGGANLGRRRCLCPNLEIAKLYAATPLRKDSTASSSLL
jgi:hypothetical protein